MEQQDRAGSVILDLFTNLADLDPEPISSYASGTDIKAIAVVLGTKDKIEIWTQVFGVVTLNNGVCDEGTEERGIE